MLNMPKRVFLYKLDAEGNPKAVPSDTREAILAWGRWFESFDPQIAFDEVGEYQVSTVFLGIDSQLAIGPRGEPLLWETMAWKGKAWEGVAISHERRYGTQAEARAGHAELVSRLLAETG